MLPPLSKLSVRFELVVITPFDKVRVPLTVSADSIEKPAALVTCTLYNDGTPVMVCAELPAITTVDPATVVMVPLFAMLPYAFKTPLALTVSAAPELIVRSEAVDEAEIVGWKVVPEGMVTLLIFVGTNARFQLPAVFQLVLTVPVHITAHGDTVAVTAVLDAVVQPVAVAST